VEISSNWSDSTVLAPFDYLFLMVFAGFSIVLSRFVRVPGGFIIGSAFAFHLLGVSVSDVSTYGAK
jgi:hypothetical protein